MPTPAYSATLETYYRRTYGEQLPVRLMTVALVAALLTYIGVWSLTWAAAWMGGCFVGEMVLVRWWCQAQVTLATADTPTILRLQRELILLSALVCWIAAIPAFVTAQSPGPASMVGFLIGAGIILITAAQHSLHRHMFLVTAPAAALALLLNLHNLGQGQTAWIYVAMGVAFIANARFLQVGNADAFQELIAHKTEADAALEASRKSQALYQLLADNQDDMVALWSETGPLVYSSPSVERTFGFTKEELAELPDFADPHADDVKALQDVLENLTPGEGVRSLEYRLRHKDGSEIWIDGTFQRLNDGSNRMLSTGRVITERKRLEQELRHALDEANAALSSKSDFLANMTHELRTPLTAIVGFSGLLKGAQDLSRVHARQVEIIHDASENLLSVVNDILDFSRLEAGAVEFEAQVFDPAEMARSTVAMLADQAAAKGLTLDIDFDGLQGQLRGDGARLRQVLTNLLSNAVKFTATGGIRVQVSQSEAGDQRNLRVEVQDSGIGVDADQLEGIFGRFNQADASVSRRYGGTGLGLAIAKRIIQGLDGEIGVDSVLGSGSTFWFTVAMPVAEAGPAMAQVAPQIEMDQALKLLIVDDNPINRELVMALLEPFDFQIETACDGLEAVEAASRAHFDIILMDVQMPHMDGLTATGRIRAAEPPGAPRIPIIAMTANVMPEQVARCLAAGMDDHVGKPISPEKLLDALTRWSQAAEAEGIEARKVGTGG